MASKRNGRRPPRNIYTQTHTEQEFQEFIAHSKSKNLPVPEGLDSTLKRPQATDGNDAAGRKRPRHHDSPPEVDQHAIGILFPLILIQFL